jgi:hypothetical protein
VLAGLGVFVTLSPLARGCADKAARGPCDALLYRAEADRIRGGENYYEVAAQELRARGYPTRSVFNWRTPLPMWLIGKLPGAEWAKALLGGLAIALMLLAFEATAREEPGHVRRPILCVLLLSGPLMFCALGEIFVMPVLWAGVLIGLSLCAYGVNRPLAGVAFGLAAVFFRELALPYCLLALAIDCFEKRRREALVWFVGLAAWAAFYAWHCLHVSTLIGPGDVAHRAGWIQFGGAGFVIATAQVNAYLLLLPQWLTAIYVVAGLLGLAGWNTPLGRRVGLTACAFAAAFAAVGQEFNQYWGALSAPLWCFGVARFPASLRDLWQACAWKRAHGTAIEADEPA